MDINIIEVTDKGKDFSPVKESDVVILPAFGASVQEMSLLNDLSVQIVDTTCPWVAKVCAKQGFCPVSASPSVYIQLPAKLLLSAGTPLGDLLHVLFLSCPSACSVEVWVTDLVRVLNVVHSL
jgi:hypothetical protein